MKLIKNELNFLQACQELSANEKLFISRKAWDCVPYVRYDEFDGEYYEDEGKKFFEIDCLEKSFDAFYDDVIPEPKGIGLKITDVFAQDWEVWDCEY